MECMNIIEEEKIQTVSLNTASSEGGAEPPGATIITWKGAEAWAHLLYCKDYCDANPNDYLSRKVYSNYLRWYRDNSN